jgi:hypothetical protein
MKARWATPHEFVAFLQRHVRTDEDALLLFTGEPGKGKSTVMAQILGACDPDFPPDLMLQNVEAYLEVAPTLPKWRAVGLDEAKISRRKSMTKINVAFIDDLQICRGRNLIMGLCFPFESQLDRAVLEERVFRKIHVPKRGLYIIYRPEKREIFDPRTKEKTLVLEWVFEASFTFAENTGPWWDRYVHVIKAGGMRNGAASPSGDATPAAQGGAGGSMKGRDLLPGRVAALSLLGQIRAREEKNAGKTSL